MRDNSVTVVIGGDPALVRPAADVDGHGVDVLAHVATGNETLGAVLTDLPDVVLLDNTITEPDARSVCRRIREWAPATRVIVASEADDERAYTTIVAGAAATVGLDEDGEQLALVAHQVARGESVLSTRVASRLLADLDAWAERSADPLHPPPTLTATEREVLARLGSGDDAERIATSHAVTPHLVNLHAGFAVAKLHRYVHVAERIAARQ